jgi:tetrahydromethanopterin S-methyltransferase subunit G
MAEEGEILNFIGEQFRRLNARLDNIENDLGDVKLRVSATEEHLASLMMSMAGVNSRLDKVEARLNRIERRLELTDAN